MIEHMLSNLPNSDGGIRNAHKYLEVCLFNALSDSTHATCSFNARRIKATPASEDTYQHQTYDFDELERRLCVNL